MNYIFYDKNLCYPTEKYSFSPSELFPEYLFPENTISNEENAVYSAIRNIFIDLNLDNENMGTEKWNPLGKWIKPGDCVLLKPNLVMHKNGSSDTDDLDCLVTHPSIIRCIADYCLIALKGDGKLIIGDSPVKDCDFNLLIEKHHYDKITNFYEKWGIDFNYLDFRGPGEGSHLNHDTILSGVSVNLSNASWFYKSNLNEKKYRIPNYDVKKVISHHHGNFHEYILNSEVLKADVIINLCKPKTHRKNGYTGALKNFVGSVYNKECLPHHSKGSIKEGGDEYYKYGIIRKLASNLRQHIDRIRIKKDICINNNKHNSFLNAYYHYMWKCYSFLNKVDRHLVKSNSQSFIYSREGAWFGNNTLWRSVLDLNLCVKFADKRGIIKDTPQRIILSLGDMVISGQGEGPLAPESKSQRMLLFSDNVVSFDCVLVKIMGFNYLKFVGLLNAISDPRLRETVYEDISVFSNVSNFSGNLSDLVFSNVLPPFHPAKGWDNYIEV